MSLILAPHKEVFVIQRRGWAEFVGFETRNKYEVQDSAGQPIAFAAEQQKGLIGMSVSKKWSGIFNEAFTDKDRFRVEYQDRDMSESERALVLTAAIFIDLQYFEQKAD